MIDHASIRHTLRVPLTGLDPDVLDTIRWENRTYEADPGDLCVEEQLVPLDESPVSTGTDRQQGLYRLFVSVPRGSGTEEPDRVATLLKRLYKPGQSLVGPATIVVQSREVQPGQVVNEVRYVVPVVITYRTDARREN